jgi:1,4-alpha-glucan branching enzyme
MASQSIARSSGPAQLKALVDLCHVYGIAVAFDVVYNHARGFTVNGQLDDNCIYYFDRLPDHNNNNDSLYFTDQERLIPLSQVSPICGIRMPSAAGARG